MEVDSLIRLHHIASNTTLPQKLRIKRVDDDLIQLLVEDVEGATEKQLQEEPGHYLRVEVRGRMPDAVDFRGPVEEAQTDATKFRIQYHDPHPSQLLDHPKVGVVETKSSTEHLPHQQVVVSLQSRAVAALIGDVASGHDTEHRPSATGTFGKGSSSHTGDLGTYLGFKSGVLIADAGLGPDSRFRVLPAEKPKGPRVAGRLAHEQAADAELGAAENPDVVLPHKSLGHRADPRHGKLLERGNKGTQQEAITPEV